MGATGKLWALLLRAQWRMRWGRALVSVLAIALGVALGYAVYLINQAALTQFAQASRSLAGQADLQVRGPSAGFDEALYARLARWPELAAVSPVVALTLQPVGRKGSLTLLGLDVFRALEVTPALVGRSAGGADARLDALDPGRVFLSPAALRWLGLAPGQMLHLPSSGAPLALRVAGIVPVADTELRLAVMDIGAAQWRFSQLGRLQRLDIRLASGVDRDAVMRRLAKALPAGVVVGTPDDQQRLTADLSRAYRVNLNVLALVALFTGAFLVFAGQVLSVQARRTQLGLLRALGATRRQIQAMLLVESLVLGLLGAVLGLALGLGLAHLALDRVGTDLGAGYFSSRPAAVPFSFLAAAGFGLLGVVASVLGGVAPARAAARVSAARALRAGGSERLRPPRPSWFGLVCLAAGAVLIGVGPIRGLPLAAYAAIGLWLAGVLLWMPWIARGLFVHLPRGRHAVVDLTIAQLAATPARTVMALSGVLVSFALMVAMITMVGSFRVSFDQWLDTVLPAPLYLRASAAPDSPVAFSPALQQRIRGAPGVARVEFMQTTQITLDARLPPVALIVRPLDAHRPGARLALVGPVLAVPANAPPPVWVSEAMVALYGWRRGQTVRIPLQGTWVSFTVAGIWRDYARQYGAIVVNSRTARRWMGDFNPGQAAVWLAPQASVDQVVGALRARLPARTVFQSTAAIRAQSLRVFDRSFLVTYLLEAVAILVGLFGVGVCFSAQALARAHEFGVLRHLGMTRRQIMAMLALEGIFLGALGVAGGLLLGTAIAWILVKVVNPQSFHWTMALHLPWGMLALSAVVLVGACALTACISGRRAMAVAAVRAVREDW